MATTYPSVTFINSLGIPVNVFDSFNNGAAAQPGATDYFGTLTSMGTSIAAGAQATYTPLNGPVSVYIVYDTQGNPVSRYFTMGTAPQTFTIQQSDVDIITATKNFITFIEANPTNAIATGFQACLNANPPSISAINNFLSSQTGYSTVTFISYMLVIPTISVTVPGQAVGSGTTYSLSKLCGYFGITWPSGFPDIVVSDFTCVDNNDVINIGGSVTLQDLTFATPQTLTNVNTVLTNTATGASGTTSTAPINFTVVFNTTTGYISLQFTTPQIIVPLGGSRMLTLENPTLSFSLMPLFKFAVFEVSATIPFSLFGPNSSTPSIPLYSFNADVSMTVDNVEAEVGIVLSGANATTITFPMIPGVQFSSIGVGMGIFFEPPGFALGLQGTFTIGSNANTIPTIDSDSFTLVCSFDPEPIPIYLSFYFAQINIGELVTMFTNVTNNIPFPVSATDVSLTWLADPLEPVTLPDGTLAAMEFGCTCNLDFFGLSFYGNVAINMTTGISATLTASPVNLFGGMMFLKGNGQAVNMKFDANGNPIQNNYVPTTAAEQQAVANATNKMIIAPGGPELTINSSSSPYFTLDVIFGFLGITQSAECTVSSSGIDFELTFGDILQTQLQCTITDYQNFSGQFTYGPDLKVQLPTIANVSLGTINLTATISVSLAITVTGTEVNFTASGSFDLGGSTYTVGPVQLSVNLAPLENILHQIENWIINNTETLFKPLIADAEQWATAVDNDLIIPLQEGAEYAASVLESAYSQTMQEAAPYLKTMSYAIGDVASALKKVFGPTASEVASALSTAFSATAAVAAQALNVAGYVASDIATALGTVYSLEADAITDIFNGLGFAASIAGAALNTAGYALQDVASALSSVYNLAPAALSSALQDAGYATTDIENAFDDLGGDFASYASDTWAAVSTYVDPNNW